MITINHIFLIISLLSVLASFIISLIIILRNRTVRLFQYIGLAQFFIFMMIFIFSNIYLLDINFVQQLPHQQLKWLMRIAHVSGLLGAIFWFMALELLKSTGIQNTLSTILNYRSKYLYVGLVIGINLLSIDYHIIDSHIRTFYVIPLSYILTPTVYLLFLYSQYSLFKNRIRELVKRTVFQSIIINTYLVTIFLGILLLIFGFVGLTPTSAWVLFASLSQLSFSYLIYKIPLVFLINEKPDMILFFSKDFKDLLYSKKFSLSTTISESLIASYLSGLSGLGSKIIYGSGKITKISFREYIVLVDTVDQIILCYFYKGTSYYSSTRFVNFCNSLLKNKELWPWEINNTSELSEFESLIDSFFGKEKIVMPNEGLL